MVRASDVSGCFLRDNKTKERRRANRQEKLSKLAFTPIQLETVLQTSTNLKPEVGKVSVCFSASLSVSLEHGQNQIQKKSESTEKTRKFVDTPIKHTKKFASEHKFET